jgi:IS30 family transposase
MSHITESQRYAISIMQNHGYNQSEIAQLIGKDKSVISRELSRNCDKRNGIYRYELAQRKSEARQELKPRKIIFTGSIKAYVESKLEKKYSPEQIVGEARKENLPCVSHERIYQYVWSDKKHGGVLHSHLRTEGKRYRKRGNKKDRRGIITDRVDIEQRPIIVEQRERAGDLEIDTIIGKNHKGAVVTINDRASGKLKMVKVESKDATLVAKATIQALADWKDQLKTITADNGKEFAMHKMISTGLNIDFYFAKPYHSWERGSNENLNGLIRQYIPKKSDFTNITNDQIKYIEEELNNRPRKRFNFETPNTIFNQLITNQKVAFVT